MMTKRFAGKTGVPAQPASVVLGTETRDSCMLGEHYYQLTFLLSLPINPSWSKQLSYGL